MRALVERVANRWIDLGSVLGFGGSLDGGFGRFVAHFGGNVGGGFGDRAGGVGLAFFIGGLQRIGGGEATAVAIELP